jgi:uncharacterized protein (TIGR03000 family)
LGDPGTPAPTPEATYHPTYGPLRNNVLLSVKVPADAKVFINDHLTQMKGADREYISHNLQSDAHYDFAVRVEFIRNGQTVSKNKTAKLTAGQSASFDFTQTVEQTVATPADTQNR